MARSNFVTLAEGAAISTVTGSSLATGIATEAALRSITGGTLNGTEEVALAFGAVGGVLELLCCVGACLVNKERVLKNKIRQKWNESILTPNAESTAEEKKYIQDHNNFINYAAELFYQEEETINLATFTKLCDEANELHRAYIDNPAGMGEACTKFNRNIGIYGTSLLQGLKHALIASAYIAGWTAVIMTMGTIAVAMNVTAPPIAFLGLLMMIGKATLAVPAVIGGSYLLATSINSLWSGYKTSKAGNTLTESATEAASLRA